MILGASDESGPGTYRRHADGALEFRQRLPSGELGWVIVAPSAGGPGHGVTWRRFVFNHVHAGPLGAHKSSSATVALSERLAAWPTLRRDVEEWCAGCWTCQLFRRTPTRIQTSFIATRHKLPFHHVFVDVEGKITPCDESGAGYILSLIHI